MEDEAVRARGYGGSLAAGFCANRDSIDKRLTWNQEKISSALEEVTPQNAHKELFEKRFNGMTLFDAMLRLGVPEMKTKFLQILQETENDKFTEILSHGPVVSFLADDAAGGEILFQKLTSMGTEELLKVLGDYENGKKIFAFLRRNEEGCAFLERQFADPAAFIQLIGNSWFSGNELSFFTMVRGNCDIEDTDSAGNPIIINEWTSGVADPQLFPKIACAPGVLNAAMEHRDLCVLFLRAMAGCTGRKIEDILTPEMLTRLMQTPGGEQIFENMRAAARGNKVARNLFVGLLKNEKVVLELSKIPRVGGKLIDAMREFNLPLANGELIRAMCSDALFNLGQTDEAVWGKILETPENRAILWGVCNGLAEEYGSQAQVLFSRLTHSEIFRHLTIGHEPGYGHAASDGTPGVLAEMGRALNSSAKRALLLGKMPSETTYGASSRIKYTDAGLEIPELLSEIHASPRWANFAQEMLRRNLDELFMFLDGMDANDVADILTARADNGLTLLEFAVLNRRDFTVMKLADYYRKRGVPFSRVGMLEMLVFKEKTFTDAAEALKRADRATDSVYASMGGAVSTANPTRSEWLEIRQKFSRKAYPTDYLERQSAALEDLIKQKQATLETDQGFLLEVIGTYEMAIAEGESQGRDVKPLRAVLDDFRAKSDVGVSGRIKLAIAVASGESNAKAAFDGYMDKLIGTSVGAVKPAATTLDARILDATAVKLIGRDEAGWLAVVDGAEIRIENIGELVQCQRLETITFNSLIGSSPFTADELFSLRNVKSLKRLDVGRFSRTLTPNLVEILFRARTDLTITAILGDGRTLVWEPKRRPNMKGQYSHSYTLRPGVEVSAIKRRPNE
jgi:hypothetical protein